MRKRFQMSQFIDVEKINVKKKAIFKYAIVPLALVASLAILAPSHAGGGKKVSEWKHDFCKTDGNPCGGVVYANEGAYTVNWVRLSARGDKDQDAKDPTYNQACLGMEKKLTGNLNVGEYHVFIVPATCKYKIKIDIKSGEKKDSDLKVTPACILITHSKGTTTKDNKIKQKDRKYEFSDSMTDAEKEQLKTLGDKECKVE